MIIDFHTHIFPDKIAAKSIENLEKASGIKAATDGTLQGLLDSMDKNNVDISVIMPVYNTNEKYFREAIESILNQTFSDLELIIVDDCSTDNSRNILEEYAQKDSRILKEEGKFH